MTTGVDVNLQRQYALVNKDFCYSPSYKKLVRKTFVTSCFRRWKSNAFFQTWRSQLLDDAMFSFWSSVFLEMRDARKRFQAWFFLVVTCSFILFFCFLWSLPFEDQIFWSFFSKISRWCYVHQGQSRWFCFSFIQSEKFSLFEFSNTFLFFSFWRLRLWGFPFRPKFQNVS